MSNAFDRENPPLRRTIGIVAAGIALYVGGSWLVQDRYYQLILTIVPIWAAVGVAFNLFSGYSGLLSFGHAAFFGIGAYTVALLFVMAGVSPWIGIVVAGAVGGVAGLIIGYHLPPAWALLRPRNVGVSPGLTLSLPVAWVPGGLPADG